MARYCFGGVLRRRIEEEPQPDDPVVLDNQTFQSGFGLWTTPGTNSPAAAWSRGSGATPSVNTGPNGGANPATRSIEASQFYAFTESSDAGANVWSLESPEIDASVGTTTLTFDLHMRFGSAGGIPDGELKVQGWNGSSWSDIDAAIVGSQQLASSSPYLPSTDFGTYDTSGFSNPDFRFRFRFARGVAGATTVYDAAVDNLVLVGPPAALSGGSGGPGPGGNFPSPLYGGAYAPWAIPAAQIATHPNSAALVGQIYNAVPNGININVDRFAPAIFDLQNADTTKTFVRTSTNFGGNLTGGESIPWNDSLFQTPGDFDPSDNDSYTVLVDSVTGLCYEFFQSDVVGGELRAGRGTRMKLGVDNDGGDANIFSKQNVNRNSRACGMQHVVGVVLRSEIDAGFIPHAMTLAFPNPTQFAHEAPAIKGAGGTGGPAGRGFMGLRIVWDLSQSDIDDWENSLAANIRTPMRVIANCLRDFGAMATDHSGTQAIGRGSTQLEHRLSGKWDEINISNSSVLTALHSLLIPAQGKARVLAIPTHAGGTDAGVACYPGIDYPPGHPCNS